MCQNKELARVSAVMVCPSAPRFSLFLLPALISLTLYLLMFWPLFLLPLAEGLPPSGQPGCLALTAGGFDSLAWP